MNNNYLKLISGVSKIKFPKVLQGPHPDMLVKSLYMEDLIQTQNKWFKAQHRIERFLN